jgi:hypothetical protein
MVPTSASRRGDALKRWHRRIGLMAALFVLALGVTGFCLNHTGQWQWDQLAVRSPLLLRWYGVAQPEHMQGYSLDGRWLSELGGQLFVDAVPVAACQSRLVGALKTGGQVLAACSGELVLLTDGFEVIERIAGVHALPIPVERIGADADRLFLLARGKHYTLDLNALSFAEVASPADVQWSTAQSLPNDLVAGLAPFAAGDSITLERVLLDIHSGRVLGAWAVYLVDVMAGLFVLLAVTGVIAWQRGDRNR